MPCWARPKRIGKLQLAWFIESLIICDNSGLIEVVVIHGNEIRQHLYRSMHHGHSSASRNELRMTAENTVDIRLRRNSNELRSYFFPRLQMNGFVCLAHTFFVSNNLAFRWRIWHEHLWCKCERYPSPSPVTIIHRHRPQGTNAPRTSDIWLNARVNEAANINIWNAFGPRWTIGKWWEWVESVCSLVRPKIGQIKTISPKMIYEIQLGEEYSIFIQQSDNPQWLKTTHLIPVQTGLFLVFILCSGD